MNSEPKTLTRDVEAAVVPVGRSPEGLPVGVQVIGRPYREDEVLAVASCLQERFGWSPPPFDQ